LLLHIPLRTVPAIYILFSSEYC